MLRETLALLLGAAVSSLVTSPVMAMVLHIAAPWLTRRRVSYARCFLTALLVELGALSAMILVSLALGRPQPPLSPMLYSWIGQAAAYWVFGFWLCARLLRDRRGALPAPGAAARLSLVMTGAFLAKNLVAFWVVTYWFMPEIG